MKTVRLTKKQLTELEKNGKLWGRKYYYEAEIPGIVKYHEIYYIYKDQGRRLMTDEYAEYYGLWRYGKIKTKKVKE